MKYLPVFLIFTFFLSSLSAEINEPVRHQVFPGMILPSSELVSRTQPSGDEIVSPAQFDRVEGVLLAWSGWDQELIRDISYVISQDDCVYMLVSSIFNQAVASSFLQAGNVNMDNVYFIIDPDISGTSMWIRDYGPFYIYEDGVRAIVDFFYGVYWGDDDIPFTIAAEFDLDIYESNLMHHGGNHISDGNGMAFCTTNIFDYNPSYSQHDVRAIFKEYLGIDSLVVIDKMNSDGTGHIDMFCKLLSDTLFIVGEYAIPEDGYPGNYEILNNNAELLASLHNLEGQSFRVERIPMPPFTWGGPNGFIPYSYTNSLICNNKVLVPVYGFTDLDTQALAIYADLMPDYEIYGIDSSFIIEWWGAVHCVTNLHFAENPLVVLHQPVTDALPNSSFSVRFRVNPGFEDIAASVLYRNVTDTDFNEAVCCFQNGIWQTTLPTTTEDLLYYIDAVALSGETELPARYPENAPEACCLVSVSGTRNSHDIISTDIRMYNYPNPFNPSTVIAFSAYGVKQLRIRIYNLKGQIVKEMQCDTENTGHDGSVVWDGTDRYGRALPGGVYYIQLLKGDLPLLQKKCVLLK